MGRLFIPEYMTVLWMVMEALLLFCTLIHHGAGLVCCLSAGRFWVPALSCVVLSAVVIWLLVRFLRQ